MRPMKWLGEKPFHTLLLLTERPARWAVWQVAPLALLLAAAAGLLWARAAGEQGTGWAVALTLLLLAVADWVFLALLPRWQVSFGPVQPPWLGLTLFRGLVALAAVPLVARWPLTAWLFLLIVQLLVSLLLVYGTVIEPFRLQVSRVEIVSHKFPNPGLPVRIVQLSDLHVERRTRREGALPSLVAGLAPDLIVLTGDFLSTSYNDDPRAVADLRDLLGQLHAPAGIYAVWGTSEVDLPHVLRPALTDLGIVPLEDEAVEVQVGDSCLWLMGLDCTRDLDAGERLARTLLGAAPPGAHTVLLFHMPDLMPRAVSLGVDLILAGHTHGGQWRLPGFGAILTSSRYWKRYEAGRYHQGDTDLYVSRGLGMEGFGALRARFFCPPEVVLITLSGRGAG